MTPVMRTPSAAEVALRYVQDRRCLRKLGTDARKHWGTLLRFRAGKLKIAIVLEAIHRARRAKKARAAYARAKEQLGLGPVRQCRRGSRSNREYFARR
jgi:hypothetical protein